MSRVADPRTRISLLRAAEEVFAKSGLEAAKVEDIAKIAGVSKGAFYLHFETKEEAFLHVVEAFLARAGALLGEACPPELPSKLEDLIELGLERDVQLFEFFWQNRAILFILNTCNGPYAYLVDSFRKDLQESLKRGVEFFVERGAYRKDLDPNLVATLLMGAYSELAAAMLTSEKKPPLRDWLLAARQVFSLGLASDRSPWEQQRVGHVSLPDIPEPLPSEPAERPRRVARAGRARPAR